MIKDEPMAEDFNNNKEDFNQGCAVEFGPAKHETLYGKRKKFRCISVSGTSYI